MKKPRVAIHSVTGCAGCQLTIYFIKDRLLDFLGAIDLVAAPMIKGKNDNDGPYDVCFVEGSVCSERDLEHVKKWREQSKILVAFGTCATHANVQGIKNFRDAKEVQRKVYGENPKNLTGKSTPVAPTPIEDHVKVDFKISGCPPEEIEFLKFCKDYLMELNPRIYNEPVCVECTKREIRCLLEDGKECMGPLIRGGCNALCPGVNHGCTGCHGPIPEANIPQTIELLKANGIPLHIINQHMQKYAGLEFEKLGAAIRDEVEGKVKLGIVSLFLGIIAVLSGLFAAAGFLLAVVALVCGVVGIILGIISLKRKEGSRALPVIGIVLCVLGVLLLVLLVVLSVNNVLGQRGLLAGSGDNVDSSINEYDFGPIELMSVLAEYDEVEGGLVGFELLLSLIVGEEAVDVSTVKVTFTDAGGVVLADGYLSTPCADDVTVDCYELSSGDDDSLLEDGERMKFKLSADGLVLPGAELSMRIDVDGDDRKVTFNVPRRFTAAKVMIWPLR